MVGIPGTEERLALAEIEDRLRRVRARFNLYSLQHNLYGLGIAFSLGVALLILGAFLLSPWLFTLLAWPLLALLAFFLLVFLRRGVAGWTDLTAAARRIDALAGLKERLSTLVAQLTAGVIGKPSPSSLWPHLLEDNTARLPDWEVKKVAPSRIPWSFLPFLAALLLALFVITIPLLSPSSEPNPFSLENVQTVLSDLPNRLGQVAEDKMSLLPDSPDQWGGSSIFSEDGSGEQGTAKGDQSQGQGREQESRSLASLPEELQKKIRQALQGLSDKDRGNEKQNADLPSDRLALRPTDEAKKPDFSIQAKDLPKGQEQQARGRGGQGGDDKGGPPSGPGGNAQAPAQGSGIQHLDRARLDRKNARGQFQPDGPQIPGSQGEAGAGGPGAGSGTDPRLFGNPANLGAGAHTFQLALDATHEKTEGAVEGGEKDEGGIIEKSTKGLSQRQSLDDAIRKAQIPPEYEEIVKRLFSRGESQ